MYDSKYALKTREQIDQFLGVFYPHFSKPGLKFLRQMIYGIQITTRNYYALADGIQRLLTRHGRWDAKLDLKKVLVKPSPQLEFAFADGSG